MAGYIRQDTTNNIADGNVINASDFDNEYNAIEAAFHASTGHTHDGTSAEGAPITKIGPTQDVVASATALTPKTDNTVDLGSSTLEYKDLYIDGTANIDSLVADTADINAGTIDGVTIGGASAGAATFTTVGATTGNITTVNATTVDTTNIEVTNIKAKDGTASASIADATGIVSFSANPVLSGGTANGVAYLNASKVLTTGSALTFDGTNLSVGGSVKIPQAYALEGRNAANSGTAAWFGVAGRVDFGTAGDFAIIGGTSGVIFGNSATNSEQMRLTSTGLGIGTSSPGAKLDVQLPADGYSTLANTGAFTGPNSTGVLFASHLDGGGYGGDIVARGYSSTYGDLRFIAANGSYNAFVERMRLDSSGNLGIGVTPSAWSGVVPRALQFQYGCSIAAQSNAYNLHFLRNAYFDNGWKYLNSAPAVRFALNDDAGTGGFAWFTAPSGTAGNAISFTQALTLNTNGALVLQGGDTAASGIGITFPATQNASSNANTLDDYEIGTFTPSIGSATYSVQQGNYVKIGDLVTIQVYLNWTGGPSSGAMFMYGLPFTPATYGACSAIVENVTLTANYIATPRILPSQTSIQFLQLPVGGGNLADITNDANGNFMLTASYQV